MYRRIALLLTACVTVWTVTISSSYAQVSPDGSARVAEPIPQPAFHSPGAAAGFAALGAGAGVGLMYFSLEDESIGLALLGMLTITVGASLGHFYTGESTRAWWHIGVRGAMLMGTVMSVFASNEELALGFAAAFVGTGLYSILDAPLSALRANKRARRLRLTPTVLRAPDQRQVMGLALTGRF